MIIGICGKSGSGKSTLAKLIMEKYSNTIHIDIDKIGHESYNDEDVFKKMTSTFGEGILTNNRVDRKKVSNIVFLNQDNMEKLTSITWPYMKNRINKMIRENHNKTIILDWLLLYKTEFFDMCDIRILLDVSLEERCIRCMKRDNINKEQFLLRDNSSITYNNNDFDLVIKDSNIEINKIFTLIK